MSFEIDKSAFSNYLPNQLLFLVEFTHSSFSQPFYFVNNTSDIVVNSKTYKPFSFVFNIPAQGETQGTSLNLLNVDRQIAVEIKNTVYSNENILAQIYLCIVEDNTPEAHNLGLFEVQDTKLTKNVVTLGLNQRSSLGFNIGTKRYSQRLFNNLYL